MAHTFDEVQQKLNAEIVAGNLICGMLDKRVFVGKTNEDGVFEITPEGKEMLEALNKEKPAKKGKAKEEIAEAEAE
jgi:predicted transcriptional regulator